MIITPTLSGRYRIRVLCPGGKIRQDTGWFDNLVLDAGLNRMGTDSYLSHCSVGTGTAAPVVSQTTLSGHTASTSTVVSQASSAHQSLPYYGVRRMQYRFVAGQATGNLSEVGAGWAANTLFSRALIVDDLGDPTTITVLADEALDVTYELRLFPPLDDVISSVTIGASTYTMTARSSLVASGGDRDGWGLSGGVVQCENVNLYRPYAYSGDIGDITQSPSGTSAQAGICGNAAYANNSLERGMSASWGLSEGNLDGGIRSIVLMTNGLGRYQFQFDPVIPKTSSNSLALNFKVAWGRRP